jgi:hypothetical protein
LDRAACGRSKRTLQGAAGTFPQCAPWQARRDQVPGFTPTNFKGATMGTILLIILVLVLIGALPTWPHSRNWGYAPSGIAGLIVVLLIMLLTGRL